MSKNQLVGKMFSDKKLLSIVIVLILLVAGVFLYKSNTQSTEVHYHAGFRVFVDGNEQDFSDFKYMSVKPCATDDHAEEDPDEDHIHLHDGNGKVVHLHANGYKWGDLFKSIGYTFEPSKDVVGYINGKKVRTILKQPIKEYDSVVIFVGKVVNENNIVKLGVTKSEIVKAESISESCGK